MDGQFAHLIAPLTFINKYFPKKKGSPSVEAFNFSDAAVTNETIWVRRGCTHACVRYSDNYARPRKRPEYVVIFSSSTPTTPEPSPMARIGARI